MATDLATRLTDAMIDLFDVAGDETSRETWRQRGALLAAAIEDEAATPVPAGEDGIMVMNNAARHDWTCAWSKPGIVNAETNPCTCGLADDIAALLAASPVPLDAELREVMAECDETASRIHDFREHIPEGDSRGEFDRAVWRIHNLLRPLLATPTGAPNEP